MKILMVSSYLPYPLISGGHIRLYNILKNLSKNHQITLVCEKRTYQNKADIAEVGKFCKEIIVVDRRKQWSINNILKTGFSKYPFLITGHTNKNLKSQISNLLKKEKFDLIHVETFYVMQNLPETLIPIVLTEHNIEYLVYKRFRDEAPFYIKPFLDIDILKLKKIEEGNWRKADVVIAVSFEDKKLIEDVNDKVFIVPNGVNLNEFRIQNSELRIKRSEEKNVLFIGDFRWVENRDAAGMILRDIWPEIKFRIQNSKFKINLWIVGKKIPDNLKRLEGENVSFDENAPSETAKIFEKADLLLAPIRIGGGTSFKILEAMASGVPVVTTKLGAVGLSARDKEEILIADDNQEFADSVIEVLNDKNLYEKITKNARNLVEEKYDWKKIVGNLENVYKNALSTNHDILIY